MPQSKKRAQSGLQCDQHHSSLGPLYLDTLGMLCNDLFFFLCCLIGYLVVWGGFMIYFIHNTKQTEGRETDSFLASITSVGITWLVIKIHIFLQHRSSLVAFTESTLANHGLSPNKIFSVCALLYISKCKAPLLGLLCIHQTFFLIMLSKPWKAFLPLALKDSGFLLHGSQYSGPLACMLFRSCP